MCKMHRGSEMSVREREEDVLGEFAWDVWTARMGGVGEAFEE